MARNTARGALRLSPGARDSVGVEAHETAVTPHLPEPPVGALAARTTAISCSIADSLPPMENQAGYDEEPAPGTHSTREATGVKYAPTGTAPTLRFASLDVNPAWFSIGGRESAMLGVCS